MESIIFTEGQTKNDNIELEENTDDFIEKSKFNKLSIEEKRKYLFQKLEELKKEEEKIKLNEAKEPVDNSNAIEEKIENSVDEVVNDSTIVEEIKKTIDNVEEETKEELDVDKAIKKLEAKPKEEDDGEYIPWKYTKKILNLKVPNNFILPDDNVKFGDPNYNDFSNLKNLDKPISANGVVEAAIIRANDKFLLFTKPDGTLTIPACKHEIGDASGLDLIQLYLYTKYAIKVNLPQYYGVGIYNAGYGIIRFHNFFVQSYLNGYSIEQICNMHKKIRCSRYLINEIIKRNVSCFDISPTTRQSMYEYKNQKEFCTDSFAPDEYELPVQYWLSDDYKRVLNKILE